MEYKGKVAAVFKHGFKSRWDHHPSLGVCRALFIVVKKLMCARINPSSVSQLLDTNLRPSRPLC